MNSWSTVRWSLERDDADKVFEKAENTRAENEGSDEKNKCKLIYNFKIIKKLMSSVVAFLSQCDCLRQCMCVWCCLSAVYLQIAEQMFDGLDVGKKESTFKKKKKAYPLSAEEKKETRVTNALKKKTADIETDTETEQAKNRRRPTDRPND